MTGIINVECNISGPDAVLALVQLAHIRARGSRAIGIQIAPAGNLLSIS